MDKQFQIISDSSCDLPPELAREKNIRVVPFYVSFDDKTYHFREFRIIMMPLSLM